MAQSWFPGHMAKAIKEIRPLLKLIDVVIEIVDARAPYASSNPLLSGLAEGKPSLLLLNKSDLADEGVTRTWISFYKGVGRHAVASDVIRGIGLELASAALASFQGKARIKPRALIVGMPNVGKSSLINRFARRSKAKTGDRPGITRGKQWIDIGSAELLDTPGLMPFGVEDPDAWNRLCALGLVDDDLFDHDKVCRFIIDFLIREYPQYIKARFCLEDPSALSYEEIISFVAQRRGCLLQGGAIDEDKVHMTVLRDLRSGRLGRVSLERPGAVRKGQ